MAAAYPTTVKSFTVKLDGQKILAAHVNDLQDEIVAIETDLRTLSFSAGNVGISTTTPVTKLHIDGAGIYVNAIQSDAVFDGVPSARTAITGPDGYWAIRSALNESFNIDVYNANAEFAALTILQAGNVGIGTTSPVSVAEISSTLPYLTLSYPAGLDVTLDLLLGALNFYSHDASTTSTGGIASIRAYAETAFNTASTPSYLSFFTHRNTNNDGTVLGNVTEWLRIPAAGGIQLRGQTSGYVGLLPQAAAGSVTYTLPTADGTNSQVLTTNGGGVLSWTDKNGGVAGGITSLNSQTGATQSFVNDTNVTISSATDTHTLGWAGTLAKARQHAQTAYYDQAGTFTGNLTIGTSASLFTGTSGPSTDYTLGKGWNFVSNTASHEANKPVGWYSVLGTPSNGYGSPDDGDFVMWYSFMETTGRSHATLGLGTGKVTMGANLVFTVAGSAHNMSTVGMEVVIQNGGGGGTTVPDAYQALAKMGYSASMANGEAAGGWQDNSAAYACTTVNANDTLNGRWKHGVDINGVRTNAFYSRRLDSAGSLNLDPVTDFFSDTNSTHFLRTTGAHTNLLLHTTGGVDVFQVGATGNTTMRTSTDGLLTLSYIPNADATYVSFYRNNGGTLAGSIATGGGFTNYNTTSDRRLKEQIAPLSGALAQLMALHPVGFRFIGQTRRLSGFLADEVQAVVPEAVTGERGAVTDTGEIIPQQMDAAKLIPLLVASVQELAHRLEAHA